MSVCDSLQMFLPLVVLRYQQIIYIDIGSAAEPDPEVVDGCRLLLREKTNRLSRHNSQRPVRSKRQLIQEILNELSISILSASLDLRIRAHSSMYE